MKKYFYVKAFFMGISLLVVVYAIKTLNSESLSKSLNDPNGAMSLLLGGGHRPTNWCPDNVKEMQMRDSAGKVVQTFTFVAEFSLLCEVMVEPLVLNDDEKTQFFDFLTARSETEGQEIVLKTNADKSIFQLKDVFFRSPMLNKSLERFGQQ